MTVGSCYTLRRPVATHFDVQWYWEEDAANLDKHDPAMVLPGAQCKSQKNNNPEAIALATVTALRRAVQPSRSHKRPLRSLSS